LLTNYGEIPYVWFDGAYDPFGWDVMDAKTMKPLGTAYGDAIRSMVGHLQPTAVVMGGTKPDVRWSGSEQGWAAYPLSNVVKPGEGLELWVGPQNAGWIPAEANLHTRKNWFWEPDSDKTLRDLDFLNEVYLQSIGRGANLLVNMTPDTNGVIPLAEVEILEEFGAMLNRTFMNPVGSADILMKRAENEIFINLQKERPVNLLTIEEDIQYGQHIKAYKVEGYIDGRWKTLVEGQTIGRRRIQGFGTVEISKLRLTYLASGGKPRIKSFTAYFKDF
jgi:alpha-L-fucosidase